MRSFKKPHSHAPATERNREPILALLRRVLPPAGLALEVASDTGEHAVHFARALPGLAWQPSDPDPTALVSIAAWRAAESLPSLLPPIELDASCDRWPVASADAVFCANMTHIAPWAATEGLLRGAGRLLPPRLPARPQRPLQAARRPDGPEQRSLRRRPAGAGQPLGAARFGVGGGGGAGGGGDGDPIGL